MMLFDQCSFQRCYIFILFYYLFIYYLFYFIIYLFSGHGLFAVLQNILLQKLSKARVITKQWIGGH